MRQYIIRLDDASEYMDTEKWRQTESLLDRFSIKPIFGIIPQNRDTEMVLKYDHNPDFWKWADSWIRKGWTPALHGYEHLYVTEEGGLNPINRRSEFAGLPYEIQAEKIEKGWKILRDHGIMPDIFFAPSHTFDQNTLKAIKNVTDIRVISDTIANDIYKENGLWFIPQQSGRVRKLPFKTITFCYHPNTMNRVEYEILESFLKENFRDFIAFEDLSLNERKLGVVDRAFRKLYFFRRRSKNESKK